jgi:hypothetical protein
MSSHSRQSAKRHFFVRLVLLTVHSVLTSQKNTEGVSWHLIADKHMKLRLAIILVFPLFASPWMLAQMDHGPSTPDAQTAGLQPKRQGGKDDLDAIGNRKIGGKGFGNWYSLESEIALGREYAKAVESGVKLLDDPVIAEYVNRIGQNLVRNSDAKVPFTIKVIDSDEINAFALPGGFMYVHSGLILVAQDEAQLAGVMAHEIASRRCQARDPSEDSLQLDELGVHSVDFCRRRRRFCDTASCQSCGATKHDKVLAQLRS